MFLRRRGSRVAFAFSLVAQSSVLATIGYLGCGSPSPADGMPPCSPWIPFGLEPILPGLLQALAVPAVWLVPEFDLPGSFPNWVDEWTWYVSMAAVNVLIWTIVLGFGGAAIKRLARGSHVSIDRSA